MYVLLTESNLCCSYTGMLRMFSLLGCMALKKLFSFPYSQSAVKSFSIGGRDSHTSPPSWLEWAGWSCIALCIQPQLLWVEECVVLSYPEDTVYICPPTLWNLWTFLYLEPWVEEGDKDVSFVVENNFLLINFLLTRTFNNQLC